MNKRREGKNYEGYMIPRVTNKKPCDKQTWNTYSHRKKEAVFLKEIIFRKKTRNWSGDRSCLSFSQLTCSSKNWLV